MLLLYLFFAGIVVIVVIFVAVVVVVDVVDVVHLIFSFPHLIPSSHFICLSPSLQVGDHYFLTLITMMRSSGAYATLKGKATQDRLTPDVYATPERKAILDVMRLRWRLLLLVQTNGNGQY